MKSGSRRQSWVAVLGSEKRRSSECLATGGTRQKAFSSVVAIVRASSTRDEASEAWELLTSPVGRSAQAGDEEFENFPCQNKVSVLAKAGCCARMTARSADKETNSLWATSASVKFTSAAPL
jgi:hypothetical protein